MVGAARVRYGLALVAAVHGAWTLGLFGLGAPVLRTLTIAAAGGGYALAAASRMVQRPSHAFKLGMSLAAASLLLHGILYVPPAPNLGGIANALVAIGAVGSASGSIMDRWPIVRLGAFASATGLLMSVAIDAAHGLTWWSASNAAAAVGFLAVSSGTRHALR